MADANEGLNTHVEDTQVVAPPARSIPGGGQETMGGAMRSTPGGGTTEDLGGVSRHVVTPKGAAQEEKTNDAEHAGAGSGGGPAGSDGPAGASDTEGTDGTVAGTGETGGEQQPEAAGGEGQQAALEAALAALPEETRTALEPFSKEFAENGKLAPESVTAAAAALGVPEALVNFHLAAIQAATPAPAPVVDPIQAQLVEAAYSVAGGSKETYGQMVAWLKAEGLAEKEQPLLDAAIKAGNPELVSRLVGPLYQKFKESGAAPNTRRTLTGEGAVGDTGEDAAEGYANQAEMFEAMRVVAPGRPGKTKYETDPAYRATVNQKIAASSFNKPPERS